MAIVNVVIERPREQVWDVLSDGYAFQEWVVGTQKIRDVDAHWPELGAGIHYSFGWGPLTMEGQTVVRQMEPGKRLGLEADAGPLGTARILIQVDDWGDDTVVILDEHPLRGPSYLLHNTVTDALLLLRGRPMVQKLATLVERRHPR